MVTQEDDMNGDGKRPGRRPWIRLDLLLSQAEAQLSEATYDDPHSVLASISYLTELSDTVQRELDYAYICLREQYNYGYGDIAYAMGRPWEHDLSYLLLPVHDPDLSPGWRAAKRRYVEALKRQFGPRTQVPPLEYVDLFKVEMEARVAAINGEEPPEADGTEEANPERSDAAMKRMRRLVGKLGRKGALPEGISIATSLGEKSQAGVVHLCDSAGRVLESIPIDEPRDPEHPLEGLDRLVIMIARRAQHLVEGPETSGS